MMRSRSIDMDQAATEVGCAITSAFVGTLALDGPQRCLRHGLASTAHRCMGIGGGFLT